MNKWQYLLRNLWFLKGKALGASSRLYVCLGPDYMSRAGPVSQAGLSLPGSQHVLNATKINFAITWQPGQPTPKQPDSCNQALRLWKTSEVFGLLRKTSDFIGNLRKWLCCVENSRHCQDKNLTLSSRKKLAGRRSCTKSPPLPGVPPPGDGRWQMHKLFSNHSWRLKIS